MWGGNQVKALRNLPRVSLHPFAPTDPAPTSAPPALLLVPLASGAQVRSQEAGQGDWEGLVHTQAGAPSHTHTAHRGTPGPSTQTSSPSGLSTAPISWHQAQLDPG